MNNNWKAIITNKSQVDASGTIEVSFQVYKDEKLIYDNLSASGASDTILDTIKQMGTELKEQVETANEIKVGQEVSL